MAHQSLKFYFVVVSATFFGACGSSDPQAVAPTTTATPIAAAAELPLDPQLWGTLHSQEFGITVRVPDAAHWLILLDPRHPETFRPFTAGHVASKSALVFGTFIVSDLMNRARCEEKIRDLGRVPKGMANAHTIEDVAIVGPGDFDTRVWVSFRPGQKSGELIGDLFAFGSHIRKCLFVHFATLAHVDDLDVLSARLAAARKILDDLKLDQFDVLPPDVGEPR